MSREVECVGVKSAVRFNYAMGKRATGIRDTINGLGVVLLIFSSVMHSNRSQLAICQNILTPNGVNLLFANTLQSIIVTLCNRFSRTCRCCILTGKAL